MPVDLLGAVTAVGALIAFGLLCGAYLCPKHFDENYREWTERRKRRNEVKSSPTGTAPGETPTSLPRS